MTKKKIYGSDFFFFHFLFTWAELIAETIKYRAISAGAKLFIVIALSLALVPGTCLFFMMLQFFFFLL